MSCNTYTTSVTAGNPIILFDRVKSLSTGEPITPDDISLVNVKVYDLQSATPNDAIYDEDYEPNDIISASLVTNDPRYKRSTKGYNVEILLPGEAIPDKTRIYKVVVTYTPYGSGSFNITYVIKTSAD